jgi:hypothetical protein
MRPIVSLIALLALMVAAAAPAQTPLESSFTYQGRLVLDGAAVDQNVDLRLTLWDSPTGGANVGQEVQLQNVPVADGLFSVELDFGPGVFTGDSRWLDIEVRAPHDPQDQDPFTTLTPRQEITAVPYALYALDGAGGGGGGDSGLWELQGGSIVNIEGRFVGINRDNRLTSAEMFGVHSPVSSGYGGMYVSTEGQNGLPFYGYNAGGLLAAWTYFRGADQSWRLYNQGDRLVVTQNGNVGIGTTAPDSRLTVNGLIESGSGFKFPDGTIQTTAGGGGGGGSQLLLINDVGSTAVEIFADDPQGGTPPAGAVVNLYDASGDKTVDLDAGTSGGGSLALRTNEGVRTIRMLADYTTGGGGLLEVDQGDGFPGVRILGHGGFAEGSRGGEIQMTNVDGDRAVTIATNWDGTSESRVVVDVVEITGGSDLSEQFDVRGGGDRIEPGTVVSIDPASPGALQMSRQAYDRRVAGIVSGAGGVKPGMLMGQRGSVADGELPVALTGRVYCKVDASHGAVAPGDLLTTSPTPGHAMKVTDHGQAQGAILGKAMTSLDRGQGLVLVLVSLQ